MSITGLFFTIWTCAFAHLSLMCIPTETPKSNEVTPKQRHVIIWVHGTKLTPTPVWHSFFFRLEGMHPIMKYETKYHLRKIAETLTQSDPSLSLEDFYVFGWSGKLSFKERLATAQDFYKALDTLNQEYIKKDGIAPIFTIITHSHGGNVALNLVKIKETHAPAQDDKDFLIDRLILLACPVQDETKDCIAHPFFKHVISFYSSSDMLQVMDPQGLYSNEKKATSLFSKRIFPHHEKLVQIRSTKAKRGLMHIDFLSLKFVQHIPHALQELSDLLVKHPDTHHCSFELNADRSIFRAFRSSKNPFSLSICIA